MLLKFIKSAKIFLSTIIIVYLILIIIIALFPILSNKIPNLKDMRGGSDFSLARFAEKDIWIFGSSHAYRGFDPREFKKAGISIQNFGSASQHLLNSYVLLKDFILEYQPKLIMMELDFTLMNDDSKMEPSYVIFSNREINRGSFEIAKDINQIGIWNSLFYQVVHQKIYPLNIKEQSNQDHDNYVIGGFVETDLNINYSINKKRRSNKMNFDNLDFSYADRIISLMRREQY